MSTKLADAITTYLEENSNSNSSSSLAPGSPTPELTTQGILSIIFVCVFVALNVSGTASSIAALCITAQLFYWGGIITEQELWEGFGNGGILNLASLAVLVAALGNVPLVKKVAVFCFGGTKENRHLQLAKILGVNYVIALFLPNANQVMLITPLLRNACLETGMNVQYALMPMCIVANIANGFAISSNSNIIVNGLWRARFGYDPNFFVFAGSNFAASILTTIFLVFMTPFFFNSEMENADGNRDSNNAEKVDLARNPLNEKYSVLFQVFDTRNLQYPNQQVGEGGDGGQQQKQRSQHDQQQQCIIGLKESEALAFVPADLLSRLQLKWISRSLFDKKDGGDNNDDFTAGDGDDDEEKTVVDDNATELERKEVVEQDQKQQQTNNNNPRDDDNNNKKQTQQSKQAEDSDTEHAKDFKESTRTPLRIHIPSHELDPTSKHHEKSANVTITTTTTTRTVNGKTVVVKEQHEEKADERVIEKDDIVSVRGNIKDLRTFRGLLSLAWTGVADIGRSRIVFQKQSNLRKVEAEKRRHAERLKMHTEGIPPLAPSPAPAPARSTTANNNNNDDDDQQHQRELQPTPKSSTKTKLFHTAVVPLQQDLQQQQQQQRYSPTNEGKPVSRSQSQQILHEGEIPLPAHPLTSEALAALSSQDPTMANISTILNKDMTDADIDQLSDDVIGQFKNSSICYLRHASGALYLSKACALYHGLDAFQPASTESVSNTHIFVAVASNDNPALGQRLESRMFCEQFGCAVLACRPFATSKNLLGRELAWHRLEAGDTIVVRVRPKAAYLWSSTKAKRAFFDIIAAPGSTSSMLSATDKDKLLRNYVEVPALLADYLEVGQRSVTMRGRVVNLVRLPNWYFDWVPILIFAFFVITTMAGASVPIIALLTIPLLIWSQIITVHEALQTADWKLYTAIAFAYAIGSGIASSGLARWIGYTAARSGVQGFTAVLMAQTITGVVSCIVGNQGTPTVMFPIAIRMMRTVGIDELVGLVIVGNASVQGFLTTFGLPSNLIIATPGRYEPKHFLMYGAPVFVVYGLLSALFTTLQFGLPF